MQPSAFKRTLIVLTSLLALTAASAPNGQPGTVPPKSHGINPDGGLLDSYIQFVQPQIAISDKQSDRDGRTTLTVKLTESSVSKFTPVVSPQVDGITVDVLNTWDALKNMAQAFRRADEMNQKTTSSPRMFPRTSLAARAATVAPPPQPDHAFAATETPQPNWFVSFPPNLLMLPFGQPTAATADVLDISYDDKTAAVSLHLDVVHNPTTFSQFIPGHAPHALDTAAAHYHYATRPGMTVDAPALLKSLKESSFKVDGLHVFLKSEPLAACGYDGALTTGSSGSVTVGSTIEVTLTIDAVRCPKRVIVEQGPTVAYIEVTGPATAVKLNGGLDVSTAEPDTPPRQTRQTVSNVAINLSTLDCITSCRGTFGLQLTAPGDVAARATGYQLNGIGATFENLADPALGFSLTAVTAAGPAVAKVVLLPAKAYRRCGDPISLTAIAYTAAGVPVPNVNISFALFGDCEPDADSTTVLTNANGAAKVKINAHKPGAVAVVAAAAAGANGAVVISAPSHVIYFENRDHIERREREYFGPDRGYDRDLDDDRWRHDDDASYEHRGDHDAWRYGHEAAKLAQQRALGAPVSVSN